MMEGQGISYCELQIFRMGSDVLKLPYIVTHRIWSGKKRPDFLDLFSFNIKEPCSDRCHHPLVHVCSVDIAVQIFLLEYKMTECMSPINNNFDSSLARHPANFFNRKDLTCNVCDVTNKNELGTNRDILFEKISQNF